MPREPRKILEGIFVTTCNELPDQNPPPGASHLLCLCPAPKSMKKLPPTMSKMYLNTKKHPISEREWIMSFGDIHSVLAEGMGTGGVWIVAENGAVAGLVVLSFLVSQEGGSIASSFAKVSGMSEYPLSEALFYQLQLWSAMKGRLDFGFEPYSKYQEDVITKRRSKFTVAKTCLSINLQTDTAMDSLAEMKKGKFKFLAVDSVIIGVVD